MATLLFLLVTGQLLLTTPRTCFVLHLNTHEQQKKNGAPLWPVVIFSLQDTWMNGLWVSFWSAFATILVISFGVLCLVAAETLLIHIDPPLSSSMKTQQDADIQVTSHF